jgi:hypothetical protein
MKYRFLVAVTVVANWAMLAAYRVADAADAFAHKAEQYAAKKDEQALAQFNQDSYRRLRDVGQAKAVAYRAFKSLANDYVNWKEYEEEAREEAAHRHYLRHNRDAA